jgi:hypothetical protein
MDFTTEPRIAGFFATHGAQKGSSPNDESCIICLNTEDLAEFWNTIATVKPDWPEPQRVVVDVPELWRLQAQRGVFLFLPFEDFEQIYAFDRIFFPAEPDAGLIPVEDVYPKQQSDLEILLDQFFMLETAREGSARMQQLLHDHQVIRLQDFPDDGIESECFKQAGLPVLNSWNEANLGAWQTPAPELWSKFSEAPQVEIEVNIDDRDPKPEIARLAAQIGSELTNRPLRNGPVIWTCHRYPHVSASLGLYWDGVRRWPYSTDDLPEGLALTAVCAAFYERTPAAQLDGNAQKRLAELCLGGSVIEVEIAMSDRSYTRGFATREDLADAVRSDFASHLREEWQSQIVQIQHILQVAPVPSRVFDFAKLSRVFIRQIVPTQVVLRGQETGKARLYNLARAKRIGLP